MKRLIAILALLCLLLTGCSGPARDPSWEEDWVGLGNVLAVDTPADFTLRDNQDALSPNGIYYVSWSSGEGQTIENDEGEEATLYPVQVFLLLESNSNPQGEIDAWKALESENYTIGEEETISAAGLEFTVLPLLSAGEDNPFRQGTTAFAIQGNWCLCLEILASDTADTRQILTEFLDALHLGEGAQ